LLLQNESNERTLAGADGAVHRGIIPIGIPFLKAPADQLSTLRQKSMTHRDVVDLQGRATYDYETLFLSAVRAVGRVAPVRTWPGWSGPGRRSAIVGGALLA
jgi:hypothetical protein